MFVDTVVLGDTPFSIAVQEALRTMGFSSVLVYTGDPNIRYIHYEDIGTPSILCRYTLQPVAEGPIHLDVPSEDWGERLVLLFTVRKGWV